MRCVLLAAVGAFFLTSGANRPGHRAGLGTSANPLGPPCVHHVMLVVLENADYDTARAQPFLATLACEGGLIRESFAVTDPSQPNYLALTAGDTYGVDSNALVTLDVRHIGDLLEARGGTWKAYVEGYPGSAFWGPVPARMSDDTFPSLASAASRIAAHRLSMRPRSPPTSATGRCRTMPCTHRTPGTTATIPE